MKEILHGHPDPSFVQYFAPDASTASVLCACVCADMSHLGNLGGGESNDICSTLVGAIQLPCYALLYE